MLDFIGLQWGLEPGTVEPGCLPCFIFRILETAGKQQRKQQGHGNSRKQQETARSPVSHKSEAHFARWDLPLCFVGIVFVGDACGVDDGGDAAGCFGLVRGVAADLDVAVKSPAPFGFMPYASIDGESMF